MQLTQNQMYAAVGLFIVVLYIIFENNRKKKQAIATSMQNTSGNIQSGNIQGTVSGTIANTQRYTTYIADVDAKEIWYAGCYLVGGVCWGGGDEQKVAGIISRLTKGQLAKLQDVFKSRYGMTLDAFFTSYFYQSERAVIQQAILSVK